MHTTFLKIILHYHEILFKASALAQSDTTTTGATTTTKAPTTTAAPTTTEATTTTVAPTTTAKIPDLGSIIKHFDEVIEQLKSYVSSIFA